MEAAGGTQGESGMEFQKINMHNILHDWESEYTELEKGVDVGEQRKRKFQQLFTECLLCKASLGCRLPDGWSSILILICGKGKNFGLGQDRWLSPKGHFPDTP